MDVAEKLAQALREILEATDGYVPNTSKAMWRNAQAALAAHERAQPAKPDGYAYRYADGFLRFNQGAPVNGGKPIEAIPFYFAPPAQPASVPIRNMDAREELREGLINLFYRERANEDDAVLADKTIELFDEAALAAAPQPAKGC